MKFRPFWAKFLRFIQSVWLNLKVCIAQQAYAVYKFHFKISKYGLRYLVAVKFQA